MYCGHQQIWTSTSSLIIFDISSQDQTNIHLHWASWRLDEFILFVKWEHEGQWRTNLGKKKESMGELDPAATYLFAMLSGKPWPRTQSRPLMSPTNYQDVLQAGSGFFWPWYTPFPLCLSPWQGLLSNSMPKSASFKLLCSLENKDMMLIQRTFLLTSKPLWYNKHITCLNKKLNKFERHGSWFMYKVLWFLETLV